MRLTLLLTFVAVVCATAYFVFSHGDRERLDRLQGELGALEAQNEALAERNATLERQILALRDDPRLAERRARHGASMARPDELIFQFERPQQRRAIRVRLRMDEEGLELAGERIELEELEQRLLILDQQLEEAALDVKVDAGVGPIERQRVVDIVEESPLGPGRWVDE